MKLEVISTKKTVDTNLERRISTKVKVKELTRNSMTEAFIESLVNSGYTKDGDVYTVTENSKTDKPKTTTVINLSCVVTVKDNIIEVVETIEKTITLKEGAMPKREESTIESFLDKMMQNRQENPFKRAERKDGEDCDCPACQLKAMIIGALGDKVNPNNVKVMRVDKSDFMGMIKTKNQRKDN